MTSNYTELLINITRKAPWLLEEDKTYFPENAPEDAQQILDSITDYDLTIITEEGRIFKQYLILRLKDERVLIDKPYEWDDSVASFHIFFRSRDNHWNFFRVSGAKSAQAIISARIPARICVLQKRRFKRALPPLGTKAIFRNDHNLIDSAFIHDISEGGMLIWSGITDAGYQVNSVIREIFISLPTEEPNSETNTFHRVLPYITRGKIVRMCTDQSSSISHYGVSFIHENILLNKRFNSLIVQLRHRFSTGNTHEKGLNFAACRQQMTSPSGPDC